MILYVRAARHNNVTGMQLILHSCQKKQCYFLKATVAIQLVNTTIIHPKSADQKDVIVKPGTIHDTNKNRKAFNIKRKTPRLTMVIGSVSSTRIGRIMAFNIPKMNAVIISVMKLFMCIPGTMYEATPILSALISSFTINDILFSPADKNIRKMKKPPRKKEAFRNNVPENLSGKLICQSVSKFKQRSST